MIVLASLLLLATLGFGSWSAYGQEADASSSISHAAPAALTSFHMNPDGVSFVDLQIDLVGSRPAALSRAEGQTEAVAHLYIGDEPSRWQEDVRLSSQVIDPFLIQSTYLGGSLEDAGWAAATDDEGNTVIAGIARSTNLFGLPDSDSLKGTGDVLVAKFAPTGQLVFVTLIGGSQSEEGNCIDTDGFGNIYVAGETVSPDFPTRNAWQPRPVVLEDAYVLKLSPSGQLLYSTYLGGSSGDEVDDIFVDRVGNTYVGGEVYSDDFPLVDPWSSDVYGVADEDGFISIFSPDGQLVYSTYISASKRDQVFRITVDDEGYVYAAGMTSSSSFPLVNPIQRAYGGGWDDCFVLKLDPWNNEMIYSTFLGGVHSDECWGLAVDDAGRAYVTGQTGSPNFHLVNPIQSSYGGGETDAFVAALNARGSRLEYSTFIGGSGVDHGWDLALDGGGNVYVVGDTSSSSDFPVVNAMQHRYGGGESDAFLLQFDPAGDLSYSSFFGGGGKDVGLGVAVDNNWIVHLTGFTWSYDLPTQLALYGSNRGCSDAFVAQMGIVPTPTPTPTPTPFATDQIGPEGGSLWMTYPGHLTLLSVAPDVLTATFTFTIAYDGRSNVQGQRLQGIDHFFSLTSDPALPLSGTPTLDLFLGFDQAYGVKLDTLALYRLEAGEWVTEGITLSERCPDQIAVQTRKSGVYGVMGATLRQYLPLLRRDH
ncbi:MAG: SBBP repeat-containing protein [Anaerolineae bacterium]